MDGGQSPAPLKWKSKKCP